MQATNTQIEWSQLLVDAVNKPGIVSEAYARFWNYSFGNQLLATFQCAQRNLPLGPIHTFNGWKELGRHVTKGQKAIELCMPITCKKTVKDETTGEDKQATFARFTLRRNWFVLSQTDGAEYVPQALPEWSEDRALSALAITRTDFTMPNGNCQGYAIERKVAVSPIAILPHKTMFHEMAHIVLGHTSECPMTDSDVTPRDIREAEAEAVAMLCCESLGLPGAEHCRGYIQGWLAGQPISETSARKIFKAADAILKAGRADLSAE